MRIKRPKLAVTRGAVAMLVIGVLAGGVAALVLSNTLTATWTLHSEMPLVLEWDDDPSSSWVMIGVPNTGYLNVTNLAPNDCTNVQAILVMSCPAGMETKTFTMYFKLAGSPGGEVTEWSNTNNVFTATMSLGTIAGGAEDIMYLCQLVLNAGSLDGAYSLSITFNGDFS